MVTARKQKKEEVVSENNQEPGITEELTPKTAGPKKDFRPEKRRFITAQTVVDKHNIICKRIPFTPAVCEVCGLDLCAKLNLGDYYDLSAETQMKLKEGVRKHIAIVHGSASQKIIDEDQLPGEWLGPAHEKRKAEEKQTRDLLGID